MLGNNSNGDIMKKIMVLTIILYALLIFNSLIGRSIPTFSDNNINNILDNNSNFMELLKLEMNKKYPMYVVNEGINSSKNYELEETDLYVEMYSDFLKANLNVYIDCRNLQDYNLGCKIDDNYQDKNIYNLDKNKKTVALTFDDGPSNNTDEIVNILTNNKANATFFLIGSKIDDTSIKSLQNLLKTGNEIGSHTYNHKILTRVKKNILDDEFYLVDEILKDKLNYQLKLVRPPYGIINNYIKNNYNYSYINWNIDTLDWQSRSAKKVYNKVIGKVNDGDIILMHETYESSVKALELILPELYQEGFQVTTVSNLASLKGVNLSNNQVYYYFK
jgi:peptidoglycan/xylan/chitin deacetylase (PgdA/CDA1 family)